MSSAKKFLLESPDLGSLIQMGEVKVLDSSSTSLPASSTSLSVDSTSLSENDKVLFTNLSDHSANNRIYVVRVQDHGLHVLESIIPLGATQSFPKMGEAVLVKEGSHGGEFWVFNGSWEKVDLDSASKLQNVDVSSTTPTDGQVLTYSSSEGKWKPQDASSGSGWVKYTKTYADFNFADQDHTIALATVPQGSVI